MAESQIYHGQSIKEQWKHDIESSLKYPTVFKVWEFLDDYSYGNSENMGILVTNIEDENLLIFFMEEGPKDTKILQKLLEWRRSGESSEIGHKGGGNLRNIYGHKSKRTVFYSNIGNNQCLHAETTPDKIYELSNSDLNETEFRHKVDSSEYVNVPEKKSIRKLSGEYNEIYELIKSESGVEPGFIICMELSDISEYNDKKKWTRLINETRAKQYNIKCHLKNDLIGDKEYTVLDNIDLVGFNDNSNKKVFELWNDENSYSFYIKHDNKLYDVVTSKEVNKGDNIKLWGRIIMFLANEKSFKNFLKEFNKGLDSNDIKNQTDFYGIYPLLNDKLISCYPIDMPTDPLGKANKVKNGCSSSLFRMILEPAKNININQFDKLLVTDVIKALTRFLDKSPHKEIVKMAMNIYKGNDIKQSPKPKATPKVKSPDEECKLGGGYLIKFAHNLWKRGIVEEHSSMNRRYKEHYNKSIEKVKEFTGKDITHPTATMYYKSCPIKNFMTWEEAVGNILNKYNDKEITIYSAERGNKDREYFICDNDDFITQVIIPEINQLNID